MRTLLPLALFFAAALGVLSTDVHGQNKAQTPSKAEKNPYALPPVAKPDEATLKLIAEKTKALTAAVAALKSKKVPGDVLIEVDIYRKAAEYIAKYNEWLNKDSGKWTLTSLDRGLERAKQAAAGKAPWRAQAGKWVARAYRSEVDGSIQPYAVLLPHDYGKDPKKTWRLDVVLHGRDSSLTEAKFLASHDSVKDGPKDLGYVQLEVYGRGNNAYRWAGETDVFEAVANFIATESERLGQSPVDLSRLVLRGFSMGGAGTWHVGLHHPHAFAVIGPGAGFTTTHGYIKSLPSTLPDYQEKCLTIYDVVPYAENAFNVPVVTYSGEKDAQKAAADNIEKIVKSYPEPMRFTHLVAPGLEHKMPPEWQAKAEAEYQKYVGPGQKFPERVRFVTYTLRFPEFGWGTIEALDQHYKKTLLEGQWGKDEVVFKTENVRAFHLLPPRELKKWNGTVPPLPPVAVIDGQRVELSKPADGLYLIKEQGKWRKENMGWATNALLNPHKSPELQGPIDDAFMSEFAVVGPRGKGWHAESDGHIDASLKRFGAEWDKYMRGPLPKSDPEKALGGQGHVVLFGDPASNPLIAKVVEKLPITWTKDKLVVNGVEYDPKTHVPVLIQPLPASLQQEGNKGVGKRYVVINSGHTFHEAEFKGTNAQLFPRLGDWAVLKAAPTPKDPAAAEVVAAGLFDEFWQFPKK